MLSLPAQASYHLQHSCRWQRTSSACVRRLTDNLAMGAQLRWPDPGSDTAPQGPLANFLVCPPPGWAADSVPAATIGCPGATVTGNTAAGSQGIGFALQVSPVLPSLSCVLSLRLRYVRSSSLPLPAAAVIDTGPLPYLAPHVCAETHAEDAACCRLATAQAVWARILRTLHQWGHGSLSLGRRAAWWPTSACTTPVRCGAVCGIWGQLFPGCCAQSMKAKQPPVLNAG